MELNAENYPDMLAEVEKELGITLIAGEPTYDEKTFEPQCFHDIMKNEKVIGQYNISRCVLCRDMYGYKDGFEIIREALIVELKEVIENG